MSRLITHRCEPMLRYIALGLLAAALAPVQAGAQAGGASVTLAVAVPPQATIEHQSTPWQRTVGDTATEFVVRVVVRGNAPYRLVARRVGAERGAMTLGSTGGVAAVTAHLAPDRPAVQIARGDAGLRTFEISYARVTAAGGAVSGAVRFEAIPD